MSDGLNEVRLIGNIGSDAELRRTANNRPVVKFRLATTRSWLDKEKNQRVSDTQWHNIVWWGANAEALAKHLTKGKRLHVGGRIENRAYDDKDGVKRYITEVVVDDLLLLGDPAGAREPAGAAPKPVQAQPTAQRPAEAGERRVREDSPTGPEDFGGTDFSEDDVPF